MEVTEHPIDRVIPYARNPRQNDEAITKVAASIAEYGFRQPIVVDADMVVVAGHTRLAAAQRLGWSHVPVHVARDLTETQAQAYRLADNRLHQDSDWDHELLKLELGELSEADFDLALTGFEDDELEKLLADALKEGEKGQTDEDAAPTVEAPAVTRAGETWQLGRHRIHCANATDAEALDALVREEPLGAIVGDPPYSTGTFQESGRAASTSWHEDKGRTIKSDNLSTRGAIEMNRRVVLVALTHLKESGQVYLFTDWQMWPNLSDAMEAAGIRPYSMIVWDKQYAALGPYWRSQHELIWFGSPKRPDRNGYPGNVIPCARTGNEWHPTQKPVELLRTLIRQTSGIIYDPFLGSGTTLIAAETEGRICYGLELDPTYCDVTIRRWQEFTGQTAILEGDGRTFNELAEERRTA